MEVVYLLAGFAALLLLCWLINHWHSRWAWKQSEREVSAMLGQRPPRPLPPSPTPSNGSDCVHAVRRGPLDAEAAMLERIAAAVPAPHDTALCSVARTLRAVQLAHALETWRPMERAPTDGTIVRLLVDYSSDDACHPLEDAQITHTVGGNTDGNTGMREGWKFAGWSWEQDCFCEGRGKVIGWLPFDAPPHGVPACSATEKKGGA